MLMDEFVPLELLDLNKPPIPPRSRLYHLEPIGIGTAFVESLTSYIARLAVNHCVYSEVLINKEIMPLKASVMPTDHGNAICCLTESQLSLNGTGRIASDLVQAIETLTLQRNLRFLSMLPWIEVFTTQGLCRNHKAWCSLCYQERYLKEQSLYDPLLWALKEVLVCPTHQRQLETNCPSCHRQMPLLSHRSRPGYCSNCGDSLSLSPNIEFPSSTIPPQKQLEGQLRLAQAIGDLLAVAPHIEALPQGRVSKSFRKAVDVYTDGNIAAFARLLDLPRNTVWMWLSTKTLPPLGVVARICDWLGITIADFLSLKAFHEHDRLIINLPRNPIPRKTKQLPRHIDWHRLESQFSVILNSNELPFPTLEKIANHLGTDARSLSQHFPDLCRAFTAKNTAYRQVKSEKMLEELCELVRQITLEIYHEGKYPSENLVRGRFPKPGYFRRKRIRTAWIQTKQELGL